VPQFAPRYPDRLFRLLEKLDDESLSLAEVTRRVGEAATSEGLTRPSVPHVRALLAELRRRRADEREVRAAALDALRRVGTRNASPWAIQVAALRAAERVEERARRREAT
jgi:hypothetical protein